MIFSHISFTIKLQYFLNYKIKYEKFIVILKLFSYFNHRLGPFN